MLRRIFLLFLILNVYGLSAQESWWVFFEGKDATVAPSLSPRALENRKAQGIAIDLYDLPVTPEYARAVSNRVASVKHRSRWLNAVSVQASAGQIEKVKTLPFVKSVQPVGGLTVSRSMEDEPCGAPENRKTPFRQLEMLGLDHLHQGGFTGKGVLIAVFDNGFERVNEVSGLAHLVEEGRIIATRDYVDDDDDVYEDCLANAHCEHGTAVFSIIAARRPGFIMGAAPEASFILLRTEDDKSETPVEEDNWVAAAEFADSLGAQVFNTSLGYLDYEDPNLSYTPQDLDGNTTVITRAADLAASRGIIVVNSAGNNGSQGLNAPADGDSVIAVAAVDECREIAFFSSHGPRVDGRLKPDLAAMGQKTHYIHPAGFIEAGNGTSFSSPLIAGLAACLVQSKPGAGNMEVFDAMKQSADRYLNPDRFYGYGIPDGVEALRLLSGIDLSGSPLMTVREPEFMLFPNPSQGNFSVTAKVEDRAATYEIEIIDLMGRRLPKMTIKGDYGFLQGQYSLMLDPGLYVVRLLKDGQPQKDLTGKLLVSR